MASKSYHFQQRVLKHFKEQGFNCVVQQKAFPDIIAWKPFIDARGLSPVLFTQIVHGEDIYHDQFIPFFVTFVECKINKSLNKKEKIEAKKFLKENRCNTFLVAWKDGRKLEFQELKIKKPEIKPQERLNPTYFG